MSTTVDSDRDVPHVEHAWVGYLSWWSGFLTGPVVPIAIAVSETPGSLNRAHAATSAAVWSVLLVLWVPFSFLTVVLGLGTSATVLTGVVVAVGLAGVTCLAGSIQRWRQLRPFQLWCQSGLSS